MVSTLCSRLLGSSVDSICSSHESSHTRQMTNQSQTRPDTSVSGYSADREETSASPPVVSIDLLGNYKRNGLRDPNDCPKRRKINELQFVASSVKADLAMAGLEFQVIKKDMKKATSRGGLSIDMTGVHLMHSKDVEAPVVSPSTISQSLDYDYAALAFACSSAYSSSRSQLRQNTVFPSSQDSIRSTSSVSDTESDSGASNSNEKTASQVLSNGKTTTQVLVIPALFEDSPDTDKQAKPELSKSTRHIVPCTANAVTMCEMLQLSKTARLVTNSSAPFSIVHANAAFNRFSGISPDGLLGAPFSSILDSNDMKASLNECMVSSSSGNHKKIVLRAGSSPNGVECLLKVSPIVARKSRMSEATTATHFAIELTGRGEDTPSQNLTDNLRSNLKNANIHLGVMG